MSAPNLLRAETTENIFVEIQDCVQGPDITVQIAVMSHPSKRKMLASTSVTLTKANDYQDFGRLKVMYYTIKLLLILDLFLTEIC